MWESLARVNAVVGGVVWGPVGLALLFGTGCLLTVRTGFFQLRYFGYWMRHTIGAIFLPAELLSAAGEPEHDGGLQSEQPEEHREAFFQVMGSFL